MSNKTGVTILHAPATAPVGLKGQNPETGKLYKLGAGVYIGVDGHRIVNPATGWLSGTGFIFSGPNDIEVYGTLTIEGEVK